jgi:peptidoglycan/xylan/chitin deacetylase (PgdA/CDA1 family)
MYRMTNAPGMIPGSPARPGSPLHRESRESRLVFFLRALPPLVVKAFLAVVLPAVLPVGGIEAQDQRDAAPARVQALHLFSGAAPPARISAAGGIDQDDEYHLFEGSSLRFGTDGDGANVHAGLTGLDPIDIDGKAVVIWVRVDHVEHLNELRLYFGNDREFSDRVVYMIDRDRTQLVDDTWLRVTLPPGEGQAWGNPDRKRMTAIQLWVNDRGTAPVQVWFDGLGLLAQPEEAQLVFTFDDGWRDQFTAAAPVMARYGFAGTAYIIPDLIDTDQYMTRDEVHRLRNEYGWSIGAHELTPLTEGTPVERAERMDRLVGWFEEEGIGSEGIDLAYPNGLFDSHLLPLVAGRFRSARTIAEFGETIPPGDEYRIRVFNVVRQVTVDQLTQVVVRAQANRELLVLVFHRVLDGVDAETVIAPAQFERMVEAIAASGIQVVPISEVILADEPGHHRDGDQPLETIWDETIRIDAGEPTEGTPAVLSERARISDETSSGAGARAGSAGKSTAFPSPVTTDGTFSFGFDWKFVSGTDVEGERVYYSQLDELFLTFVRPVGEYGTLAATGGIRPVTFDNLETGEISGDDLYLDSIVLTDRIGRRLFPARSIGLEIEAGYRDHYPRNKWAQVTQWSAVESPFAQDLTAKSLWIGLNLQTTALFATAAVVPDFVGKKNDDGARELTNNPDAGTPHLFFNLGTEVESGLGSSIAETALAVGGDAIKWVALFQNTATFEPWALAASLGWKAIWGKEFETYPVWEPHQDGLYTVSAGLSPSWTSPGGVTTRLGVSAARDDRFNGDYSPQARLGLDLRVFRDPWIIFAGTATYDIDTWNYAREEERTAGWEAGVAVASGGIVYAAGFTTAGFAMQSGLYGNALGDGGGDGLFVRIRTAR